MSSEVEIKPSGITSYWNNGNFVILYDKEIWNTYSDEENSKVCFYLKNRPNKVEVKQ